MKKNGLNDSLDPGVFQKMSKIMRILFVLIFGISMAAQAKSYAQNTRIDVDLNNSSVREVINYVENNSKFIFLYKNSDLDMEKRVSLKLTNASIDEILSVIFSDDNISYDIYDRQIVVRGVEKQVQQTLQGDRKITGIVSDDQGEPLPGVSVIVTGTTKGTVTDLDGKFNLNVPGTAASITVSFIGMKAQEVLIGQKSQFVIVLEQDVEGIDEVVVVGYGTQQKANITASVSQIKGDILENRAVTNVSRGLQGAVSNLNITSTSYGGEPGASMDLNIRGLVTVNSDGDVENGSPLVLVDGVEMAINDVNPEDVETISVLKDASAAAIYGSRAAAGVILITTKNGKNMNGGMKIDYSSNFS
ncbi:carboxypeptidase-like regulatory domain-containing protein [Mangrovibacterium sp.]|uniref:SusC/RagA family TonB-linked outer membrane protein n=1 Tax=Mangrovibacterium sp. TaxID=1961364 RepID=UPI003561773C